MILKGPKREIFVAGIFTEIRPVWVGDLETRPKNLKSLCLGLILPLISWDFSFSTVGYSAKKYKMAIFRPKPSQIFFFGLVPKSPIHIGLIYVKNPKPNISCLGPFNNYAGSVS